MIIIIQNQFINKILASKDPTLITLNNLTDEFFSDYKDEFNYIKNHLQRYGNIPDEATFLNIFPDFDIIPVNESNKYFGIFTDTTCYGQFDYHERLSHIEKSVKKIIYYQIMLLK